MNSARGEVAIEIGGTHYVARFDFDAIMCLETHFGSASEPKPLQSIFQPGKPVAASVIPVVLWAVLRGRYASEFPTVAAVSARLDLTKIRYYSEKVGEVFKLAQQLMGGDEARPTLAPVPGAEPGASIGTNSSAQPA